MKRMSLKNTTDAVSFKQTSMQRSVRNNLDNRLRDYSSGCCVNAAERGKIISDLKQAAARPKDVSARTGPVRLTAGVRKSIRKGFRQFIERNGVLLAGVLSAPVKHIL